MSRRFGIHLLYALAGAAAVYVFSQWDALTNRYVIGDDVRQQIYWMQRWGDPGLYPNDLLTEYAMSYVPWGIKAIYAAAFPLVDPLRFSSILSGLLFIATAGFLFGLGLRLQDKVTAVLTVCVFCFLGHFMENITSGLARSSVYPLLAAQLYFLSGNGMAGAGVVTLLASVLNPYAFLLCLGTYGLYVFHRHGRMAMAWIRGHGRSDAAVPSAGLIIGLVLAGIGCLAAVLQYSVFASTAFGSLVTRSDMIGKPEYSAAGRYEIFPLPSLLTELTNPWVFNLPFHQWGPVVAWCLAGIGLAIIAYACWRRTWDVNRPAFGVFAYLLVASLILFVAARVFVFRLFVPGRYIEFSLNLFYCAGLAIVVRTALRQSGRLVFPVLTTALFVLAACAMIRVGVYDYSRDADLYRFVESTPKTSLVAGHPDVMDNVLTFSRRKAFVTYELSHTWYTAYWNILSKRTYDLFRAYYSDDVEEVRGFCRDNGVDYLVVRDADFDRRRLDKGGIYFQPFDDYIRDITRDRSRFVLLDRQACPPVYERHGIRVITAGSLSRPAESLVMPYRSGGRP